MRTRGSARRADAPPSPPRSGDAFGSTELPAEVRSEDESAPGEADADFQSAASSDDGDTSDGVEAAFADLMTTGAFADGGGAGDTSGDDEDGGGAASDGDGSPDPPPRRAARLVDRRAITAYIQRALMAADDGPRRGGRQHYPKLRDVPVPYLSSHLSHEMQCLASPTPQPPFCPPAAPAAPRDALAHENRPFSDILADTERLPPPRRLPAKLPALVAALVRDGRAANDAQVLAAPLHTLTGMCGRRVTPLATVLREVEVHPKQGEGRDPVAEARGCSVRLERCLDVQAPAALHAARAGSAVGAAALASASAAADAAATERGVVRQRSSCGGSGEGRGGRGARKSEDARTDASPSGHRGLVRRGSARLRSVAASARDALTGRRSGSGGARMSADLDAPDATPPPSSGDQHLVPARANLAHTLLHRELASQTNGGLQACQKRHLAAVHFPPVRPAGVIDSRRSTRCYIGQYSRDGSLLATAYQDAHIRIFDVRKNGCALRKDVEARRIRWTITDTAISGDSKFLLYSTIGPFVHLVKIAGSDVVHSITNITEVHEEHDFGAGTRGSCGVWSLCWSGDSQEVVAGTTLPGVVVYDMQRETVKSTSLCHEDDVNAVTFLDASCDVIVSGSDDTNLFVHDRRMLGSGDVRPQGVLPGHTEGVTHVSARGDGRHLISNGKDSTLRVWDVRKMRSGRVPSGGVSNYDYRWQSYPYSSVSVSRDCDVSLMAMRGHDVASTLIRCHWSPLETTGGRYVYSGSACGTVFIFDAISGHVVHELRGHDETVRDCSWHPKEARLASVSWDGTVREWRGRDALSGAAVAA